MNQSFHDKPFESFYNEYLKKTLRQMDADNKKSRNKMNKMLLILTVLVVIELALALYGDHVWKYLSTVGWVLLLLSSLIFSIIYIGYRDDRKKEMKQMRHTFKKSVIVPFLRYYYNDFRYIPRQRMGKKTICKSRLFRTDIIKIEGEDFMRFRLDGVQIQFSELILHFYKNTAYFNGVFMSADFHKPFKTRCIVLPETWASRKRGKRVVNFDLLSYDPTKSMELVELEAGEFEDAFIVYGDSQIETRFILTPSLMHRMVDYKKRLGNRVFFSFVDNHIYMKMEHDPNLFEPRYQARNEDPDFIKRNLMMVNLFTDIVEELNLNTKIFKT
ncbi:MAG: DUF3137 domain-containing protein [Bacteroidales bacterium]